MTNATTRKRLQRERQKAAGNEKIEIIIDVQEKQMLIENCALCRPSREPYELGEYITTLIRRDNAALKIKLEALNKRCCGKCGERLPVANCCLTGDSECWATNGWHELKLMI
jgi:hypothetical protein